MLRRASALLVCIAALLTFPAAANINLVNAEGSFTDGAVWIYQTTEHHFGYADLIKGTNENIAVMPPNIPADAKPAAIVLLRHPMDFHGYPLHISVVDKRFGIQQNVGVQASMGGDRHKYEPGTPLGKETLLEGSAAPYMLYGPVPASGSIPDAYRAAFDYAKVALTQLNLPDKQKNLDNYSVMFVDTDAVTWMEFAPAWGPAETPHLGCQTELGRDMVFGYEKRASDGDRGGPFLQCL